jgi:hypothetical protein
MTTRQISRSDNHWEVGDRAYFMLGDERCGIVRILACPSDNDSLVSVIGITAVRVGNTILHPELETFQTLAQELRAIQDDFGEIGTIRSRGTWKIILDHSEQGRSDDLCFPTTDDSESDPA